MSDPTRGVLGNLVILAPIFLVPALALCYLGSLWARAGAVAGAVLGIWLAGQRDPPPYGRLLYRGPARRRLGREEEAYVSRLRAQRRRLPLAGLVLIVLFAAAAGVGAAAGHPRHAPFTGGEAAPGSAGWILHQAGLTLVAAWIALLAGVSAGWLGMVLAERGEGPTSAGN